MTRNCVVYRAGKANTDIVSTAPRTKRRVKARRRKKRKNPGIEKRIKKGEKARKRTFHLRRKRNTKNIRRKAKSMKYKSHLMKRYDG